MNAQDLKNSILQLAVQGKLVEQRAEEGTAKELLEQIKAEKEKLIKEKKIKKEKPLPEITEDEIPFEIPESWEWVRWGTLSYSIQYGFNASALDDGHYRMVRISDIQNNQVLWDTVPFCEISEDDVETYLLEENDILFARTGGTVGKSFLVKEVPYEAVYAGYLIRTRFNYKRLVPEYLKFFMESQLYWKQLRNGTIATAQPNCNGQTLSKMIVPIPPFEEQKRIVAKIEEILPYIEQYDKAYTKLEIFNKKFPEDMKKSILQLAMQGKLVEQRPEEGTADELYKQIVAEKSQLIKDGKIKKEKLLPEITEDEIPFEIPSSWKWVRLGQIISIESGKGLTSSTMKEGRVPVFGGNGITGYHNEALVHKATVVIGRVGFYCGSVHLTPKEAWVTDNAFITTFPENSIDREYLIYMLRHMNLGKSHNATAQPVVSGKKIYPLLFPLPPLAEQKRIVSKIEELLPYCDQLVK